MSHCIILDGGYRGEKPYDSEYRSCHENCQPEGSFPFEKELRHLLHLIGQQLEQQDFHVCYTRCDDTVMTPSKVAELANTKLCRSASDETQSNSCLLSFHRSLLVCPGQQMNVEIFVYERNSPSSRLAYSIMDELELIGFRSLGVQERPNLTILRRTMMPALFISLGNLPFSSDTPEENLAFLSKAADAFVRGILSAYQIPCDCRTSQ